MRIARATCQPFAICFHVEIQLCDMLVFDNGAFDGDVGPKVRSKQPRRSTK